MKYGFIEKSPRRFLGDVSRRHRPRFSTQAFCAVSMGVVALVLYSGAVAAATSTGTLPVSATFVSACSVGGGALNFGTSLNPTVAGATNASGTIAVKCTSTTTATVALDGGLNGTSATTRKLKNGSSLVPYQLYINSPRTVIWGNGFNGGSGSGYTGNGSTINVNVYGQIPDLTGAVPGNYSDTVTVTVTY